MPWTTNLLVIANRTVDSEELQQVLRARSSAGPIHVTLIAPGDTRRATADARLERAIERLAAEGISVEGTVGAPDPLVAVEEVWDPRRFDEIIVTTLPTDASRWMALDLPRRIARLTDAKVTHVVASARPTSRVPRAHA
jgi:hypothetical protein